MSRPSRFAPLVILLLASWSPPASAQPSAVTAQCIHDNEAAQEAMLAHNYERARELALACASARCSEVLRADCEAIVLDARTKLKAAAPPTGVDSTNDPAVQPEPQRHPGQHTAESQPGPTRPETRSKVPSYVLASVAVVGAASFGFFALRGKRLEGDLDCGSRCPDTELDPITQSYLIADISLGVGAVALAGAIYFWPWGESETVSLRASPRGVRVGLSF